MTDGQRMGMTIRRARERKRWTQAQLAAAIGVSRTSVDAWENDRAWPRNSIGALEQVLGISLNGTPAPAPQPGPLDGLGELDELEREIAALPMISDDDKQRLITLRRDVRAREEREAERGHRAS